jgi:hypothetical protein
MANELSVLEKSRLALVAVITAAGVGTDNIFNGKSSEDKPLPVVICDAKSQREDPPGSGNFWVDLEVQVKTTGVDETGAAAGSAKTASDTLNANVLAALEVDDLAALLSAATPHFTVLGFGEEKSQESDQSGDVWVETWKRRAYACGTAF